MSGPILITTSDYTGPDRRGILMNDSEERRQSQEVAIARLEVNVEYIKTSLDEIRTQLRNTSCSDCEAMQFAKKLEADTNNKLQSMVTGRRFTVTTAIAVGSLALVILEVLLKMFKVL